MDKRQELGTTLDELKGRGGLTVDLVAARFVSSDVARNAFAAIVTKARQTIKTGRGVAVVYGTLTHGAALNVAGIICPVWDTEANIRWLGETTVEGLEQGGLLKLSDQNRNQFGWPSSPLAVYEFAIVQPPEAVDTSRVKSLASTVTPVAVGRSTAGPDQEARVGVRYTCGKCDREVHTGPAPADANPEWLGSTALFCPGCDDIVCVRCGASKMQKGGTVPCGKCGQQARWVDANHHPSWYPGPRPTAGQATQELKTASVNLKSLIGKLNDTTRRALEGAAGLGLSRTHYNIEIGHFLAKLVDANSGDVACILTYFELDRTKLSGELTRSLDKLKCGNARTPVLSLSLVKMMTEAWTVGSIDFSSGQIRSGYVILALLGNDELARLIREVSGELQKINAKALEKDFPKITANSSENVGGQVAKTASVHLKLLIAKLNNTTRGALEGAAGLCLSRTHHDVEIEHFLVKLLDSSPGDLACIIRYFQIDRTRLAAELAGSLDRLKSGNARTPALSPTLVKMLKEAWTLASIDFASGQIRSGYVILALVCNDELVSLIRGISLELPKIKAAELKKDFCKITSASTEDAVDLTL